MINLIPPSAKRQVIQEYWIRVVSVWLFLVAAAGLTTILLALPVYFLIHNINTVFSSQSGEIKEQQLAFVTAEETVKNTNLLIEQLSSAEGNVDFTDMLEALDSVASNSIVITQVSFVGTGKNKLVLNLVGIADTRSVLSTFAADLDKHPLFKDVDLPIGNLAKDRDVAFTMSVALEKQVE